MDLPLILASISSDTIARISCAAGPLGSVSRTVCPAAALSAKLTRCEIAAFQHRHRIARQCFGNISSNRRTYDFAVHRKYGFKVRLNNPNLGDQIHDLFAAHTS